MLNLGKRTLDDETVARFRTAGVTVDLEYLARLEKAKTPAEYFEIMRAQAGDEIAGVMVGIMQRAGFVPPPAAN